MPSDTEDETELVQSSLRSPVPILDFRDLVGAHSSLPDRRVAEGLIEIDDLYMIGAPRMGS